jgi:hypothetical protein
MNEKLQRLYETLKSDGYELPPIETFSQDMTDTTKAQRLYDTMSQNGYELPKSFDSFYSDISPVKPTTESTPSSPTFSDVVGAGIGAFNRGVMQTVSAPLKLEGALEQSLGVKNPIQMITDATGLTDEKAEPWGLQAGKAVENFTEKINPRYDNVSDLGQNLAEGVGQVAGMIGTAGLGTSEAAINSGEQLAQGLAPATGRALGEIGQTVASPVGILGGAQTAVPEWEQAKASGLNDDDAFKVLIKNYAIGQTDAIALENILGNLNKASGGGLMNAVKQYGASGIQEFAQEGFQTYLTNKVAESSYDPSRDPMFQVLESATVGGLVGLFIPGIHAAINRATNPSVKAKLEEKLVSLEANKAIDENTNTGDPVVTSSIDNQVDEITKTITEQKSRY